MNFKQVFALILVVSAFMSCKKNHIQPKPQQDTNQIYFVGNILTGPDADVPTIWHNGVETGLPVNSQYDEALAIAVNGTDVYAVGYRNYMATISGISQRVEVAAYWKNGVPFLLADSTSQSFATNIFIDNGDVYITGSITASNDTRQAVYWKNGVLMSLQSSSGTNSSQALGVVVSNGDVYVVGNAFNGVLPTATYWKNGVPIALNNPNITWAEAAAIAVDGSDVYVAGTTGTGRTSANGRATVWKDGVATIIGASNLISGPTDIKIQNGDVYVAGQAAPLSTSPNMVSVYSFVYWKNGQIQNPNLTGNTTSLQQVGKMAIVDTNIYVAGTYENAPVYWNNGQMHYLPGTSGSAVGVAVTTN